MIAMADGVVESAKLTQQAISLIGSVSSNAASLSAIAEQLSAIEDKVDCEAGGQETWGHATQNLPQYALRVDQNGDIYAEGLDELLYGRLSNVL